MKVGVVSVTMEQHVEGRLQVSRSMLDLEMAAYNVVSANPPRAESGRWEVHALRGDATNSNILHGSKAHVCEVTSLFHHALDTDFRG